MGGYNWKPNIRTNPLSSKRYIYIYIPSQSIRISPQQIQTSKSRNSEWTKVKNMSSSSTAGQVIRCKGAQYNIPHFLFLFHFSDILCCCCCCLIRVLLVIWLFNRFLFFPFLCCFTIFVLIISTCSLVVYLKENAKSWDVSSIMRYVWFLEGRTGHANECF